MEYSWTTYCIFENKHWASGKLGLGIYRINTIPAIPISLFFWQLLLSLQLRFQMAAITRLIKRTSSLSSFARGFSLTNSPCEDRNIQWVFLGCPGVGKGTYASRLCNLLGVPHIATGDLVRHELSSNGPLSSQVPSFSIFFLCKIKMSLFLFLCFCIVCLL